MASNEMTIRMEKHTLQSPGDSQAVMVLWRTLSCRFCSHAGRNLELSTLKSGSSGLYLLCSLSVGICLFKATKEGGAF